MRIENALVKSVPKYLNSLTVYLSRLRLKVWFNRRKAKLLEESKKKARVAQSFYEEGMMINQIAKNLGISNFCDYLLLKIYFNSTDRATREFLLR